MTKLWIWVTAAAVLVVALGGISTREALAAVGRGTDVYLFLTGMMSLAELGRLEGLFDWIAGLAVKRARGSAARLFWIFYGVGTVVTVLLSNDATAVVLTPAVLSAVQKARVRPLPYVLICAFVANAASFVLPISNPANLVVCGSAMPGLGAWVKSFGLASLASILATFVALRWACRRDLAGPVETELEPCTLGMGGKLAGWGMAGVGLALMGASAMDWQLGLSTFVAAAVAVAVVAWRDGAGFWRITWSVARGISWTMMPLVAGLFVLMAAAGQAGALGWMEKLAGMGGYVAGFGVALLSNAANNLPVGLLAGSAVRAGHVSEYAKRALLIGVDLGPNLSVTGSLATILWLDALRRENLTVGFWKFLGYGAVVMVPALGMAILAARVG